MNPALECERHPDHQHAVGHLVLHDPFSLLASSDVDFLAAAGRELFARMEAK